MNHYVSFWEQETYFSPQDFIIVGSGLVGLWTAYALKKKYLKAKITILERGVVPTGASTRNAGFACFGSPSEMISDIETMGENDLWNLVEMRYRGIEKMRDLLGDESIGFDRSGGYECFTNDKNNFQKLEDKINLLNIDFQKLTKVNNVFKWNNEKLKEQNLTGFDALIENKHEGGIHSGKLVLNLSKMVQNLGVQILYGMEVKSWQNEKGGLKVETNHCTLKTNQMIVATNAFSNNLIPQLNIKPSRGQILVTEPISGLKLNGTFHFDEGYYYFRNIGNRILLGGARNADFVAEETTDLDTTSNIQQSLETFLQHHIIKGVNYKISNKWSGVMAFTQNKMPIIRVVEPNVTCIVCCNGMGVAISPIIAEKVANLM